VIAAVNVAMQLLSITRPVTMVVILGLYMTLAGRSKVEQAVYALSAAFFVATSALIAGWIRSTRWFALAALWAEIVVVGALTIGTALWHGAESEAVRVLYAPLLVSIPLRLDRKHWRLGYFACALPWVIGSFLDVNAQQQNTLLLELTIYGTLFLFFGTAGYLIRTVSDERSRSEGLLKEVSASRAALERAHRQLQESAATQQQMAVLEERQRLAREIHDGVAHGLTALVVQLQAARRLMDRDPAQVATIVTRCEEIAREALQETRRAVRALHPAGLEQQNEVEALQRLARDFGLATGMQIDISADDAVRHLPPDHDRLEQLFRIAQESLSNAARHGHATRALLDLAVQDGQIHVTISNDGQRPDSLEPGVGLRSMAERAHTVGGSVSFQPLAHGFAVAVSIPIKQEVAS